MNAKDEKPKSEEVSIGRWPEEYRYRLGVITSHRSLKNGRKYTGRQFLCDAVNREYDRLVKGEK